MKTKKMLLVAVLLLSTTIASFSQDRGYFAVSLGSSTPVGDFASADPNNPAAGYAKSGFMYDFSFGYKFGKRIGMAALVRGQSNMTDAQALADQVAKETGYNTTVTSGAWKIGGYMIGAYGSFPISEKVSIETKAMGGFLTATSPNIKMELTQGAASAWVKMNSASSGTFSYLVALGFKYNAGKRLCLLMNVDYLGANPLFVNAVTTYSDGSKEVDTWSQKFGTFNYNVGLGFRFGK